MIICKCSFIKETIFKIPTKHHSPHALFKEASPMSLLNTLGYTGAKLCVIISCLKIATVCVVFGCDLFLCKYVYTHIQK